MHYTLVTSLAAAVLLTAPAIAREPSGNGQPEKPVTSKDVSASAVAATPVTDLNLRKTEMPPALATAIEQGYSLRGLSNCQQLTAAIGDLDAVLGDDIDLPTAGGRRISAGRVAQYAVGSFIPFRNVIREVSGASQRERDLQAAILAGVARRSFLKGTGQARGCRYPARSAPLAVVNQRVSTKHDDKPDGSK